MSHGLFTQGATSHLNCVLQVLFQTEDFREAVERFVVKLSHYNVLSHQIEIIVSFCVLMSGCIYFYRHSCGVQSFDNHLKTFFDNLKRQKFEICDIIKKLGIKSGTINTKKGTNVYL